MVTPARLELATLGVHVVRALLTYKWTLLLHFSIFRPMTGPTGEGHVRVQYLHFEVGGQIGRGSSRLRLALSSVKKTTSRFPRHE